MVSVVVSLYNYAHLVEETIQSILKQTYTDWELIIVDDGSTDSPLQIIGKFLNDKIRYIRTENQGYGAAKNVGVRNSVGEYVVIIDADDMLTPASLAIRVAYLEKHPKKQWVIAKAFEFSGLKPPYQFKVINRRAVRRLKVILKTKDYTDLWKSIHAQTVMVRRSVHEKVGLYEETLPSRGDKEMWARIISNVGIPGYVKKEVACYRHHRGQMHKSKQKRKSLPKLEKRLMKFIKNRRNGNLEGVPRL